MTLSLFCLNTFEAKFKDSNLSEKKGENYMWFVAAKEYRVLSSFENVALLCYCAVLLSYNIIEKSILSFSKWPFGTLFYFALSLVLSELTESLIKRTTEWHTNFLGNYTLSHFWTNIAVYKWMLSTNFPIQCFL